MPEQELQRIADESKMIVNGYAFSFMPDGFIRILNLDYPDCAMVVSKTGELVETMHVHASDKKLSERGSAKFFVKANGDTVLQSRGTLTDRQARIIREFIKENYLDMYKKWKEFGGEYFFHG